MGMWHYYRVSRYALSQSVSNLQLFTIPFENYAPYKHYDGMLFQKLCTKNMNKQIFMDILFFCISFGVKRMIYIEEYVQKQQTE